MTKDAPPLPPRSSFPWIAYAGALVAALCVASALVLAALGFLVVAAILGASGVLVGVAVMISRALWSDVRLSRLTGELETQRRAIASIARDLYVTARSTRRLEQTTRRGVTAVLGADGARAATATSPDGPTLAAMISLGTSRELHFLGSEDGFHRHRDAWRTIDPDASLGRIPEGEEVAYLDRRGQQNRGGSPSFPTFVVEDADQLERLLTGDLADLAVAILRVPDYLVVLPYRLRATATRGGPGTAVEAIGDTVVLVRRTPPGAGRD
jgi:hypothetical protein